MVMKLIMKKGERKLKNVAMMDMRMMMTVIHPQMTLALLLTLAQEAGPTIPKPLMRPVTHNQNMHDARCDPLSREATHHLERKCNQLLTAHCTVHRTLLVQTCNFTTTDELNSSIY